MGGSGNRWRVDWEWEGTGNGRGEGLVVAEKTFVGFQKTKTKER